MIYKGQSSWDKVLSVWDQCIQSETKVYKRKFETKLHETEWNKMQESLKSETVLRRVGPGGGSEPTSAILYPQQAGLTKHIPVFAGLQNFQSPENPILTNKKKHFEFGM